MLADVTSDAAKIEAVAVEDKAGVGGPAVGEVPVYRTFGAAGDENRVHGYRTLLLAEFQPGSGVGSRCKKLARVGIERIAWALDVRATSRASASLIPGHVAQPGSPLSRDRSDVDGRKGAPSNPESLRFVSAEAR